MSVVRFSPPVIWSQMGYTMFVAPGATATNKAVYAEPVWGPDFTTQWSLVIVPEWPPQSGFEIPEPGLQYYKNQLQVGTGWWFYTYNLDVIHVFNMTTPAWQNGAGEGTTLGGEITYRENDMPGTGAITVDFDFMAWQDSQEWHELLLSTAEIRSSDPAQWGYRTIYPDPSPTWEMWDKDPRPFVP